MNDTPDTFLREYDWIHFREKYEKADDRSCAVLFAAYLDNCVTAALLANVAHPSECEKRLLPESAPLGSLSAKIDLLRVLGLLDEVTYKDLHFVRKIRNKFAHEMRVDSFSCEPIKSWCLELELPKLRSEKTVYESLRTDPRTIFIICCALCEGVLMKVRDFHPESAQPAAPPNGGPAQRLGKSRTLGGPSSVS